MLPGDQGHSPVAGMRADGRVTEGTLPGARAEHARVTAPSEVADQRLNTVYVAPVIRAPSTWA
jgi:hypothetical protein